MTEAEILEMTYFDRCTVKRVVESVDVDSGLTSDKEEVIYSNIKCSVSKLDSLRERQEGHVPSIDVACKLFISPMYKICIGDVIEVTYSDGNTDIYLASKPFYYSSHIEVPIVSKERV